MTTRNFPFSSVQIDFPKSIQKDYIKIEKKIIKKEFLFDEKKGMGYEKNPHVTVLYGIHDINPPIELIDIIETYPKFSITLGDISLFKGDENNNDFDVIKINIHSPDLYILNNLIKKEVEYTTEYPEYIPHATLAYVKANSLDHLENLNIFQGIVIPVSYATFSSKNGTHRFIQFGIR